MSAQNRTFELRVKTDRGGISLYSSDQLSDIAEFIEQKEGNDGTP